MDARTIAARMRLHRTLYGVRRLSSISCAGLLVVFSLSVAALSVTGCRSGMNTDLLERELRMQEDRIYELEDHLEDCHAVAETYRQEHAKLQRQLDGRKKSTPKSPMDISPPVIEEENGELRGRSLTPEPTGVPGDAASPRVPPDESPVPEATSARPISSGGPEELPLPIGERPAGVPLTETGPVDRIVLHRMIVPSRPPAPEGLVLQAVIEPRDANGQPVRGEGDVSLMVLDPRQSGAASRLGRWNFSGDDEDADVLWRRTGLGSGLHIEVPIPAKLPDDTYELWARLVTPKGEKHLTNVEFNVDRRAVAGQTDQTAPLSSSVATRPSAEEPTLAAKEVAIRSPGPATPSTADPDQRWRHGQGTTPQPMGGPLTEASRWSPAETAAELAPPDAPSPPSRQASRPRWSPYR